MSITNAPAAPTQYVYDAALVARHYRRRRADNSVPRMLLVGEPAAEKWFDPPLVIEDAVAEALRVKVTVLSAEEEGAWTTVDVHADHDLIVAVEA